MRLIQTLGDSLGDLLGTRFDFLWGAVAFHAVGVGVAVGWVEGFTILSRQQADGMAKSGTAEWEGLLLLFLTGAYN